MRNSTSVAVLASRFNHEMASQWKPLLILLSDVRSRNSIITRRPGTTGGGGGGSNILGQRQPLWKLDTTMQRKRGSPNNRSQPTNSLLTLHRGGMDPTELNCNRLHAIATLLVDRLLSSALHRKGSSSTRRSVSNCELMATTADATRCMHRSAGVPRNVMWRNAMPAFFNAAANSVPPPQYSHNMSTAK